MLPNEYIGKALIPESGNQSGTMSETALDSKGRVLIPEKIRKQAGLAAGTQVRISVVKDSIVTIRKAKDPKDFIREFQGMIKEGSPARKGEDPLKLKEIWGKR